MAPAKPLAIDLCCGLGGWAAGFLAEGYRVVGYDVVPFPEYPGELVLRDVRTLDPFEFRGAAVIVASPPCNEFSYRDLPWGRRLGLPPPDVSIFRACEWIGREAGRPCIIENVRGAQNWVGPACAHLGPFYLWGDVPALLPICRPSKGYSLRRGRRNAAHNFHSGSATRRRFKTEAARIPFELARFIACCFRPDGPRVGALFSEITVPAVRDSSGRCWDLERPA